MADGRAPTVDELCAAVANVSMLLLDLSLAASQFSSICGISRACFVLLINSTRQIKSGHARRFESPSTGSGPCLYNILARPFAATWHDPGTSRGRLHVRSMGGGGSWWQGCGPVLDCP